MPKVDDFAVEGTGAAAAWHATAWQPLTRVGNGRAEYATRAKLLYSATGLYFLVDCADRRLTCSGQADNTNLYTEDVVEVFLWPHEAQELYFEYEISPLGAELPILVPNHQGRFHGWLPWHYEGPRRCRRATSVQGGPAAPGATVSSWRCECFIPFALFAGLGGTPPAAGRTWRGNVYRIDYDETPSTQWAWCPATGGHFHNFRQFGTLRFG